MKRPDLNEQAWNGVRMTRPLILQSTVSSWFLGVPIAYGLMVISSSIHLVNEYADYEFDAQTRITEYS